MKQEIYFSVDVEEWYSVHSFGEYFSTKSFKHLDDRINVGIDKIISLLKNYNSQCTFFILGRVAENHPDLVEKIAENGFDIGIHGYDHSLVYEQNPEEFEEDLFRSLKVMEKITGKKINKYRAPSYSLTEKSLWAFEILIRNGIEIDSSITPVNLKRFGMKNMPQKPYKIKFNESGKYLIEVPPNVINVINKTIPLSSGFAFRLFPAWFIQNAFNKFRKNGILPMIIMHNWEMDISHPVLKVSFSKKMIHYYGLKNVEKKLEKFLKSNKISSINDITLPSLEFDFNLIFNVR